MADFMTPSLASATSTRIDSGCKHIQQCRVSQDHMIKLCGRNRDDLFHNKYGYCVHKDELVLGVTRCWSRDDIIYGQNAYPRVVSNLGRWADHQGSSGEPPEGIKFMLWMYHTVSTLQERELILKAANHKDGSELDKLFAGARGAAGFLKRESDPAAGAHGHSPRYELQNELQCAYDYVTVGYANTVGFAHAHHGDTMTSVHIGGLRTVMNGDFPVECGDQIQWYWPDEAEWFDAHGGRLPRSGTVFDNAFPSGNKFAVGTKGAEAERRDFYARQYGQVKKESPKYVPRVKPYKRCEKTPRLYDGLRVFAVAISSARPHEMFDIMIARQAI